MSSVIELEVIEWDVLIKSSVPPYPASAVECAMTVGVFDGVHLGHLELLRSIVRRGPNPTVVTFRENPKRLFSAGSGYKGDLYSLKQRLAVFEREGVGRVILIDFSEEFSKLKGSEFLDLLKERGKMVFLVIGSNFRCGYKQESGADFLREMNAQKGIPTEVIPRITAPEGAVSSSRIRAAILAGDIKRAAALTGRNIELDLSDIEPERAEKKGQEFVAYDFASVNRIVPAAGRYQVLLNPGKVRASAFTEGRKIYLSEKAEGLEFII
jgi:riboflavin kinase/FMN adenylyltransferase